MKAMIIRQAGAPEVFEPAELPIPEIGPKQVLVKVAATSVNPVDWKIRKLGLPFGPDYPGVLHGDVAGVVEGAWEKYYTEHFPSAEFRVQQRFAKDGYQLVFFRLVPVGQ